MNFFLDSSESGLSSGSSSPRSRASAPGGATEDFTLEDINSSGVFSSPESCRQRWTPAIGQRCKTNSNVCEKHNKKIRFYCNDCNSKECINCILLYHNSCDAGLTRGIILKLCEVTLEEDIEDFSATNENLRNIRKSFDSKVSDIKNRVDVIADGIIEEIERKRYDLKKKLRLIEAERHSSWISQMEVCQRSLKRLKSNLRKLKLLKLKDVNILRKNISADVGDRLDFIDDGEIDFDFDDLPLYRFGKIKAPPCPRKSIVTLPENSFTNRYNTCTVVIRNILEEGVDGYYSLTASLQDADFNSVYLTIQNERNGTFKISYYPTQCGEYLLHVYLDYVAIGKSPYTVSVSRDDSTLATRCCFIAGEGYLSRAWGICADYHGRLLVADRGNHCVKIFTEEGFLTECFGKMGSGPGEFIRPTGIAVDRVLRRIVVADKDNHRIQVFTLRGSYLLTFGTRGEGNGQFVYPWDVAVSERSLIAVSDSKNRRVQLFDEWGAFIRKFSFDNEEIPDIEMPRGLAFKTDGSLMVTDFNKHQVVVLDDGFESVKSFGSEGTELTRFFRPQSIDVDREGRFAVADCRNHRIQVFKPTGELCCVFGSLGRKPGEVDAPQGLCFLPGGRIAAVELNNNRIQVFEIPKENGN